MSGPFACKSVEALTAESETLESEPALSRTLGLFSLTCFGVGSTIGTGIFVLTALMGSLPRNTGIRLLVWVVVGFVVYGAYGAKHSRLLRCP